MEYKKVLVTPELAKDMLKQLDTNKLQRKLNTTKVNQYASDMKEGNFYPISTISLDKDGHILNGQHRLHAVIKSGASIVMHIMHNVPNVWARTMDTGKQRKTKDAMAYEHPLRNTKYAANVASFFNLFSIKPYPSPSDTYLPRTYDNPRRNISSMLSNIDIIEGLESNMRDFFANQKGGVIVSPQIGLYLKFETDLHDIEKSNAFWRMLLSRGKQPAYMRKYIRQVDRGVLNPRMRYKVLKNMFYSQFLKEYED